METILLSFATELAAAVITAYGVYAIILAALGRLFGRKPCRQEEVEALGGFLWFVGVFEWRQSFGLPDIYDIDLFLRYAGGALIVLPRLVLAARRALKHE